MSQASIWLAPRPRRRPFLCAAGGDEGVGGTPASRADDLEAARAAPARIVIVEDDWMVSMQIETTLESQGYAIVGKASEADEAVRIAAETRPDLVLMDVRLIGSKDGITAAISIRNQFGIPSLYVTANSDPGTVARGNAAAPAGWLEKPFAEEDLIAAVRNAIEQCR